MIQHEGWTGVVLAGGRSSRMGQDKALLSLHPEGPTLLDNALNLLTPVVDDLLVVGHPEIHGHVGPFVIPDDHPGLGPLGGLVTAMRYASYDRLLVIAVDMPYVTEALLLRLERELGHFTDAAVPLHHGRPEPLVGSYHRRCLPVFQRLIAQGTLKMSLALDAVRSSRIAVDPGSGGWPAKLFNNINRPEDLGSA
jgi:molybdopterin-guanine dinucleotide biosynthesis protein A